MRFTNMQVLARVILLSLTLFLFNNLHAQYKTFSISSSVGASTPLLDNGAGFFVGVNTSYAVAKHFAFEAGISYLFTNITGSFLSGESGQVNSLNILAGGRIYLNSVENKNKFFVSLLVGRNLNYESFENDQRFLQYNLGYGAGFYAELGRLLLGAAYETPQNLIVKVGYVLK